MPSDSGEPARDERISYRISDDPDQLQRERQRLGFLDQYRDPSTHRALERTGVGPGWRCLEVGAGSGSITQWLCQRVGPRGYVLAVDIDTRFHVEVAAHAEVRQLDVTRASLGEAEYDLVHARALLQHLHQRTQVLDAMIAALKPGGWLVVEDSDFTSYLQQTLPEPFGTFSRATLEHARDTSGWDGACGRRLLHWFQERGLIECEASGSVSTMRGGTPSAEWYVSGLDRARQRFIESGPLTAELIDRAIAQAREPDFAILSPIAISVIGRKPA